MYIRQTEQVKCRGKPIRTQRKKISKLPRARETRVTQPWLVNASEWLKVKRQFSTPIPQRKNSWISFHDAFKVALSPGLFPVTLFKLTSAEFVLSFGNTFPGCSGIKNVTGSAKDPTVTSRNVVGLYNFTSTISVSREESVWLYKRSSGYWYGGKENQQVLE